jgi:hypothetical protein
MRSNVVLRLLALVVVAAWLSGCSVDPEQRLVGKWKGDSSAIGTAIKAAKMKADSPEVSGSTAMAAARALGNTSLTLNSDKTCALATGSGNTLKGTWKFFKEEKLVELDLQTAEIAPENQEKNPEGFKPTTYIAVMNKDGDALEVLPFGRESYDMLKKMEESGTKRQKFMVLRKR